MSDNHKMQLQFVNDFYKVLNKIKRENEIEYILTLAEDKFQFSAPEVVNYCYKIIYTCVKLQIDGVPEDTWHIYTKKYM